MSAGEEDDKSQRSDDDVTSVKTDNVKTEQSFREEENIKAKQKLDLEETLQPEERKDNGEDHEIKESLQLSEYDKKNIEFTNSKTPSGEESGEEDKILLDNIKGEQQQQFQSQQQTTITGLSGLAATVEGGVITERKESLFNIDDENLKGQSEVLKAAEKMTETKGEESGSDSSQKLLSKQTLGHSPGVK